MITKVSSLYCSKLQVFNLKLLYPITPFLKKTVNNSSILNIYRLNSTQRSSKYNLNTKISQENSQLLKTNSFFTLPNIITLTRIGCTPFIGHCIWVGQLTPALTMFGYCCITDFFDGYIARKFNMKSVVGTILDPIADKLLMIFTTLALTLPTGPEVIPYSIATLILSRDVLLGLSGVIIRFTSLKKVYGGVKWNSYWNLTKYPTVEVKPTKISKWNTFLQMVYLGCGSLLLILDQTRNNQQNEYGSSNSLILSIYEQKDTFETWFKWLGYTVGVTTVLSGVSYVLSKKAVTILPILK